MSTPTITTPAVGPVTRAMTVLLASATLVTAAVIAGSPAEAKPWAGDVVDVHPCRPPKPHVSSQHCPLTQGNVPVFDSNAGGPRVGTLVQGPTAGNLSPHWFLCQAPGKPYTLGRYRNNMWAYTMADNGRHGWVPQVYFKGGANNQADGGLRRC